MNPLHSIPFDYLKVNEFNPRINDISQNYQNTYTLDCVDRSSVSINYSDNSEYSISFEAWNDGSAGFKALHDQSHIIAGTQIFKMQSSSVTTAGNGKISVKADQLLNADFQRLRQPRLMRYTSNNTSSNIVYVNLNELLKFFFKGINNLGFDYIIYGHFPRRPITNPGNWTGKDLLTIITQTWPGTRIIGWAHTVEFFGYQKKRDNNGNLQNILDFETGERFDQMFDCRSITVNRDTSQMCNCIEVKSATYNVNPDKDDDDENTTKEEFVVSERPYFNNFLATSDFSIKKYGLYSAKEPLDNGFTNVRAAMAAAREKMVTEPVITVTADVDTPGKTTKQPRPGAKYSIGVADENKTYHVILKGFTWYPFDPAKGMTLQLNNVDEGILQHLRRTIVHDIALSPQLTSFKQIEDTGQTDDEDQKNTDDSTDRPDDTGDGTSDDSGDKDSKDNNQPGAQSYNLPISDKKTRARISRFGNLIINHKNKQFNMRLSDDDTLAKLRDGKGGPDKENTKNWQHLVMIDFDKGSWLGANGKKRSYYKNADAYVSQWGLFESGLITTTAGAVTFRTGIKDSDYNDHGQLDHYYTTKNGINYFHDESKKNPGSLATIQAGNYIGYKYVKWSTLSKKTDIKPMLTDHAKKILSDTDFYWYRYKDDDSGDVVASGIIDDVHKKKQYRMSPDLITNDGKARKDDVLLTATAQVVKDQEQRINKLEEEIKELKQLIKGQAS